MTTFDPKKDQKPIIRTDWTKRPNGVPFSQQAENGYEQRYSVSIQTNYETTNGSELELNSIKNSALPIGLQSFLNYNDKLDTSPSILPNVFAEDWFLSERPLSKIKILVSVKSDIIDNLADIPCPDILPTPFREIDLDTSSYEEKINGVIALLRSYESDIKQLQGKVQGINLNSEIKYLENSVTSLANLLAKNGVSYDSSESSLIQLGIDSDYRYIFAQLSPDGSNFKTLHKGFLIYKNDAPSKNKRTVNFVSNLDEIYGIYENNQPLPFQEFLNQYVLNPPRYDFSVLPRASSTSQAGTPASKQKTEDNEKSNKESRYELENSLALTSTPEQRKQALRKLETTANFVGDTSVAAIQDVNDWITGVTSYALASPGSYVTNEVYKKLLNKIPLQELIRGALECLGFPGFEFIELAQTFLNSASSLLRNIASLINRTIPKLSIPDNFPIADYMKDFGTNLLNKILEAVGGALIKFLVELLMSFLDACKECGLSAVADGKGRFDGINFNSNFFRILAEGAGVAALEGTNQLSQNFLQEALADPLGVNIGAARDEALSDARQSLLNPLLLNNSLSGSNEIDQRKEYERKLEAAKIDFRDYISTSGQILTPGEAGNLMLGCQVGKEPLGVLTNLANNYPNLKWAIGDGEEITEDNIKGIWEDFGKVIGNNPILESVAQATDLIPIELQCLCDADDTKLREQILKDKGLSNSQIKDQIDKSVQRKKERLEDLANALEKGNILDDMLPPIFCTIVYKDSEGNTIPNKDVVEVPIEDDVEYRSKTTGESLTRVVQKGLVEKDHPTVTFLIDQVLDTLYDAVEMAFNEDIGGFVTFATKDSVTSRQISRTKNVKRPDGTGEIVINPEWLKLVKDPQQNYTWGPLAGDASQPGTNLIRDDDDGDEEVTNAVVDDGILGTDLARAYSSGQMQTGQAQPTPVQVLEWEAENLAQNTGGRQRPVDYDDSTNLGLQRKRYSEIYGYSPIPVVIKEKGPKVFAPGLQSAYARICSEEKLFNISDDVNRNPLLGTEPKYHVYNFLVENNLFEYSGISETVKNIVSPTNNAPLPSSAGGVGETEMQASSQVLQEAFRQLSGSNYEINYIIPFSASTDSTNVYPREIYATSISLTPPVGGSVTVPSVMIYGKVIDKELSRDKRPTTSLLPDYIYDSNLPFIPQEQYFASTLDEYMKYGYQVYPAPDERPYQSYAPGYVRASEVNGVRSENNGGLINLTSPRSYKNRAFGKDYYDEIWRDFYCSFTRASAQSPYFDLSKLQSLNFTPITRAGEDPACTPTILDVHRLKQRIKDEYGLIQCIESVIPTVDGLGSNKNNAFEKSSLAGAVLTTVRTFVVEILLRSLFMFYYFKFTSPETIDDLLVSYISQLIKKDVTEKQFINEFSSETVDLYNRTVQNLPNPLPKTRDFDTALDFFVRYQIFSVANRFTKTFNILGDTSVTSYLLDDQNEEVAWIPSVNIPAYPNDPNRILNSEITPPSIMVGPVPPELVKQLAGEGTLSDTTKNRFNPRSGISFNRNLPIGRLFREYFGFESNNGSEIWSLEGPLGDWRGLPTTNWTPITGRDPVSPTKFPPPFRTREEMTFIKSGLINEQSGRYTFTDRMINALTINPDTTQRLIAGTQYPADTLTNQNILSDSSTVSAYEFGISYVEKLAMKKLFSMLAAGPDFSISNTPENDRDDSLIDFKNSIENYKSPLGNSYVYPGRLLKERTEISFRQQQFTFKYNYNGSDMVWDKRAWNNTGTEVPDWVRKFAGTDQGPYSAPRGDSNAQVGGSPLNRFEVNGAPGFWYRAGEWYTAEKSNPNSFGGRGGLRWITIGGTTIGPWKGFNINSAASSPETKWKLIDPGYEYTEPGGQKTQNSDIAQYNSRNDSFVNGDGSNRMPSREEMAAGVTVGVPTFDPAYYGLRPAEGNRYVSDLTRRAANLLTVNMPYISLLDFDLYSIKQILEWEKSEYITSNPNATDLHNKYDEWISDVEEIIYLMSLAYEAREIITQEFVAEIQERGVGRNPLPEASNPGKDFKNGNFIKEIYLRVAEHPHQGKSLSEMDRTIQTRFSGDQSYQQDVQKALYSNSNFVDRGRNEFLKGVVNIEEFQNYLNGLFDSQGQPGIAYKRAIPADCQPVPLSRTLIKDLALFQECGEAQAAVLGLSLPPDRGEFYLGDFFKSVRVGVRLSYVEPIEQNPDGTNKSNRQFEDFISTRTPIPPSLDNIARACFRDKNGDSTRNFCYDIVNIQGQPEFYRDAAATSPAGNELLYEKAYFVPNGNSFARVIPIVSSEIEIDPLTKMSDVTNTGAKYQKFSPELGGYVPTGFFEHQFREKYNDIKDQLQSTQEFKTLFRYMFPLERMLSLNIIYASEHLRTYKNIPELFDPTKDRLKQLFFVLNESGNYKSGAECIPTNKDLQLGLLNGSVWAGLATTIALMIAKSTVLIFKGFVESFDVNIIVSKAIKDSIRVINQSIAQGLTLANQAQQLGSQVGNLFSSAEAESNCVSPNETQQEGGLEACSPSSPKGPGIPPDPWFDPVPENFIPEPQIMFISLALLPITLLPLLWPGLPITPFGLAYWFLDAKPYDPVPGPNWLNAVPPSDFIDKLFSRADEQAEIESAVSEGLNDCGIDAGLPPVGSGENNGE